MPILPSLRDQHDELCSFVRVRVTCGLGAVLVLLMKAEGQVLLEDAAAAARSLMEEAADPKIRHAARLELVRALTNLATVPTRRRDVDGTIATLEEARAMAGDDPNGELRVTERTVSLLLDAGRYPQARAAAAAAGDLARSSGVERSWGMGMALIYGLSSLALGDLAAAETTFDRIRPLASGVNRAMVSVGRVELSLARGDVAEAAARYAAARSALAEVPRSACGEDIRVASVVGTLHLSRGDPVAAWREVERIWAYGETPPGLSYPLLVLGAAALATLRRESEAPPGLSSAEAEQRLRQAFADVAVWEVEQDWRALLEAELSGTDGTGTDVVAWQKAAEAAARGRVPVLQHAYSLYRLAQAQLGVAERAAAAESLATARAVADRHGLHGLVREVDGLTHRARLPGAGGRSASAGGRTVGDGLVGGERALTARERQVLELVAQGLTNRQIGDRLFISDKTASVHVSAILRKLGCSSRSQAAGRAAGVLGP